MISRNKSYDQIRYLDETGMERVRLNQEPGQGVVQVPVSGLQDKSDRYYFQDTVHGEAGMVYLSPFDLNVENGAIETPHKPVIRVVTPLHDLAGKERGVLILNVLGRPLLNLVQSSSSAGRQYMLLNSAGYYLTGGAPGHQWGFMHEQGRDWRLGHDSPEAWERIQGREGAQFQQDGQLYTAREVQVANLRHGERVSPLIRLVSEMQDPSDYHWVLVSRLDKGAALAAFLPRLLLTAEAGLPVLALILVLLWRRTMTSVALDRMKKKQEVTAGELDASRTLVHTLEGLLPICSSCSKLRDDEGYWSGVADYLTKHGGIQFTHGLCHDCVEDLYGDLYEEGELEAMKTSTQPIPLKETVSQ